MTTAAHWWADIVPDPRSPEQIETAKLANLDRQRTAREKLRKHRESYPVVSTQAAYEEWLDEMEKPQEAGVAMGFGAMDATLGRPIRRGEVVVIGARTGVGKTTICQHVVERKLSEDLTAACLFLNMEMPNYEMAGRIVANVMGIQPEALEAMAHEGKLQRDGWVDQVAPHLSRLVFAERANVTVTDMEIALENANEELGVAPTMLVVDYMGLMGGSANTYERSSTNAKQLKDFAKNFGLSIFCASQLSREGARDGASEPSLHDLRDSGVIEEAADRVLLFWRMDESAEAQQAPTIFGKIAKNRHGPIGGRTCIRFDDGMRLREMTDTERYALLDDLPDDSQPF